MHIIYIVFLTGSTSRFLLYGDCQHLDEQRQKTHTTGYEEEEGYTKSLTPTGNRAGGRFP